MDKNSIGFSISGSALWILFFFSTNYISSPDHPWWLYAAYPFIWWPITMAAGEKAKTIGFAIAASVATILYYSALNLLISPGYTWAIYPAFAVLWWPISMYYASKRKFFAYSLVGSFISVIFFLAVNYVSSPGTIWAVYPIFGVIWWPLSVYYFVYKKAGMSTK